MPRKMLDVATVHQLSAYITCVCVCVCVFVCVCVCVCVCRVRRR
jgi:hypothetical protein